MLRVEAEAVLGRLGRTKVRDVYDDDPRVGEALEVLVPGFEYPDVSGMTGHEILTRLGDA